MFCGSDLQETGILTPKNLAEIAKHAQPQELIDNLGCLYQARLLNQKNFSVLVAPNHNTLVSKANILALIFKSRHLTQDNFESLLTAAEQDNPIQVLQMIKDRINCNPHIATAVEVFNASQSTQHQESSGYEASGFMKKSF